MIPWADDTHYKPLSDDEGLPTPSPEEPSPFRRALVLRELNKYCIYIATSPMSISLVDVVVVVVFFVFVVIARTIQELKQ